METVNRVNDFKQLGKYRLISVTEMWEVNWSLGWITGMFVVSVLENIFLNFQLCLFVRNDESVIFVCFIPIF